MELKYKVEIRQLKNTFNIKYYEHYKYDNGYLALYWRVKSDPKGVWNFYGLITSSDLKFKLGEKKYKKFLTGQRMFYQ